VRACREVLTCGGRAWGQRVGVCHGGRRRGAACLRAVCDPCTRQTNATFNLLSHSTGLCSTASLNIQDLKLESQYQRNQENAWKIRQYSVRDSKLGIGWLENTPRMKSKANPPYHTDTKIHPTPAISLIRNHKRKWTKHALQLAFRLHPLRHTSQFLESQK
jgi:hypothetical protein